MTENTRILRHFEYHLEDLNCHDCLYSLQKSSLTSNGCGRKACRFKDIRRDCTENGRIKRPKGWFNRAGS